MKTIIRGLNLFGLSGLPEEECKKVIGRLPSEKNFLEKLVKQNLEGLLKHLSGEVVMGLDISYISSEGFYYRVQCYTVKDDEWHEIFRQGYSSDDLRRLKNISQFGLV